MTKGQLFILSQASRAFCSGRAKEEKLATGLINLGDAELDGEIEGVGPCQKARQSFSLTLIFCVGAACLTRQASGGAAPR